MNKKLNKILNNKLNNKRMINLNKITYTLKYF